ncbi:hypothetical protein [Bradyrhizobium sp. 199]|uniref:hypothetical protein n=1 Tax=Bradyrhizobium sp. 199 TaxID=2782664 RepID=UPI001FF9854D|nr:hypothetical protein [Bradyrhizobium sp. 199]MCK1361216.1 hypothetical protein [Bradyrhizobium sp. 199]
MTLVVGRVVGRRVSIAADTLLTGPGDQPLPFQNGVIKSCLLPGDLCVSFSNSPETAGRAFSDFIQRYPSGGGFADVVAFFERSSQVTGNEYLIAFANPTKLIKVVDGKRVTGLSKTQWIGDQVAYNAFRGWELKQRPKVEQGRAINAVLFPDDMPNSPASDLFSAMRHVVADPSVPTAGGFVAVVTNFDNGFRFSAYSDMLFDWPAGKPADYVLELSDAIAFTATDENASFAVAQVSPGFIGVNLVAFYFTKARKLFFFYGEGNCIANRCQVFRDVPASAICDTLNAFVRADLKWLLLITSPRDSGPYKPTPNTKTPGVQFAWFTEANTFPPPAQAGGPASPS